MTATAQKFTYNPSDARSCWPEGDYEGSIEHVEVAETKETRKPMLKVRVKVYNRGKTQILTDYIVNPDGIWKLRKIAQAIGLGEQFDDGSFDIFEHIHATLMYVLGTEESEKYGDSNKIKSYKPLDRNKPPTSTVAPVEIEDDEEIPF